MWKTFLQSMIEQQINKSEIQKLKDKKEYDKWEASMIVIFYRIFRIKILSKIKTGEYMEII